jgi:hypothetical protein
MDIRVVCAGGSWLEETPGHFFIGERRIRALEVVDRWLASDHHYFKVLGDDDATYILRHDVPSGRWELTLFHANAPGLPGGVLSGASLPSPSAPRDL